MVQNELKDAFAGKPDQHQWASAVIGAVVAQIVAGDAQAGASTAASGTKNNILSEEQNKKKDETLSDLAQDRNHIGVINEELEYWKQIDEEQQNQLITNLQNPVFVSDLESALKDNPNITEFRGVTLVGQDIYGNRYDARNSNGRASITNNSTSTLKSIMNGIGDIAISEGLGYIENTEIIKDTSHNYQWIIKTTTGIKYIRKIPLISGGVLVVSLNEAYKNMSDAEFKKYAMIESAKFGASSAGAVIVGGTIGGPVGMIAGVLAGPLFERAADVGMHKIVEELR